MAQQLGTSWATLGNAESYSFYSDGYTFDFEYAVDGYYERISNTTARIHLRAWIKSKNSYSWTGANKSWGIWCTDGASFDTGGQNDGAYIDSNGHHLPNDNGVSFDITHSGYFSGATFNVHFNYKIPYASQDHTLNRSVSVPAFATPPSGPSVQWQSHTWNSITTKVGVSSWGSGYSSGSQELQHVICTSAATASNWDTDSMARRVKAVFTSNTNSTYTVTNADDDWHPSAGAPNIRGCLSYKVASWVQTSVGNAGSSGFDNTTRYTPPAPLQTLSFDSAASQQTYAGSDVVTGISVTGGNSTNNNSVNVTTSFRHKTGSGSFGSWVSMGTGTPWTTKTATITAQSNASITVEARQVYQSQYSETKSGNYYTKPLPPTIGTITPTIDGGMSISVSQDIGGHVENLIVHATVVDSFGVSHTNTAEFSSTGTQTIVLTGNWVRPGTTYTISAYTNMKTSTAKVSTTTSNTVRTSGIYVPYNTKSKSPIKAFVPVQGKSKEALKIYRGDANNKSKIIYTKG